MAILLLIEKMHIFCENTHFQVIETMRDSLILTESSNYFSEENTHLAFMEMYIDNIIS